MKERWGSIVIVSLCFSIALSVLQFLIRIPTDLVTLSYIWFCMAYLLSEELGNKTLGYFEKATFYYAAYILFFFILENQSGRLPKETQSILVLSVAVLQILVLGWQTWHFASSSKDKRECRSIFALGATAIFFLSLMVIIKLKATS